jgi:predicted nucleotidyltransferase
MPTPATIEKRRALADFVERVVQPIAAVQGIVAIGSLAAGTARPDSDIDLIAFLDPFDPYALPAEAIWRPDDGSYHSIFREIEGLQIDIQRLDLAEWRDPGFVWPESRCAELAAGWVAYDRGGSLATLIAERTGYDDALRVARLDDAITWLDQHLADEEPQVRWESLGALVAHDRLNAAYGYLAAALFALNRRRRPWRNREMDALLQLPWLQRDFSARALAAACPPAHDRAGYNARVTALRALMADVIAQACIEGIYGDDPVGEAFVRSHEEPGRAWNMAEWEAEHRRRYSRR